jgi:A/G-specific adenine glycosylase
VLAKPAPSKPSISALLLGWYDTHARALPWRSPPGSNPPDPYRVWLSEVMLQQTTVAAVAPQFARWVARWPDFASLAAAEEADVMTAWAGLGYYARARNLRACATAVVRDHGGRLPEAEAALRALPGIGDYTAAAIAAIAFGRRAVVVDANVERVVARLFALDAPLPGARVEIRRLTDTIVPDARAGDFAQASMDLGATICTSRAPRCLLCPLRQACAGFASGAPERYPVKPAKKARPVRFGTMFWLEREGAVLLVRRPPKGLLGGMRALPTGSWAAASPGLAGAPADLDWSFADRGVQHLFTHFRLESSLAWAHADAHTTAAGGEWWPIDRLDEAGLPSVFRKAVDMMEKVRCG